ncbi:sulfotransferase domain-containing protein [Picosynechococcus sp. NKBG15041c]|uniref:sulfotransferase domain-containing protein n=1 Tax=Picosynechococcus sp. NKBG15041c TaxID=1407650 RepID=UPI00040CE72F|nr:sulfotransferase domain-containing protein [Picosynechococcus sp. NKBG15041c]
MITTRILLKGFNGILHFFDNAQNRKILCEKTPDYLWTNCSEVYSEPKDKLNRLKSLLPDCKLLVILRDPVKRAISAWNHHVQAGRINPLISINQILSPDCYDFVNELGILTRGLYSQQLTDYFQYFERKQVLIIFFEKDIIETPEKTLNKVCSFLEVNEHYNFSALNIPENRPQSTEIGVLLAYRFQGLISQNILRLDRKIMSKLPLKKWKQNYPSADTISDLYDYYQQDIKQLELLLGSVPSQWIKT